MTEELEEFIKKRKRRHGVQLLLTPLIDIFTLLIIFIIKGMVFSQSDLVLPAGVQVPQSQSKESLDEAPKLILLKDRLQWAVTKQEFPLAILQDEFAFHPLRQQLLQALKNHFNKSQNSLPEDLRTVQIVADRASRYDLIFNVSRFLQGAGVGRVVYVTSGTE